MTNTKKEKLKKKINSFPDEPGIYQFFNTQKELIYVGKATSLKNRVKSYFTGKPSSDRPIERMIDQVASIKIKQTDTVLEAIIWEAHYIKKFLPRYNVLGKDNKSWNYIVITKDEYPKVKTIRQHELEQEINIETLAKRNWQIDKYAYIFGPFPGLNSKAAMKLLTRLFHISHCHNKRRRKADQEKPCLYRQMNQCLGVCTKEITPAAYKAQVIKPLVTFLRGGKKRLITSIKKRMQTAAKEKRYEDAARLRDQLVSLEKIQDLTLINNSFFDEPQITDHTTLYKKIEGYDISNLGASGKVGSMVVFEHGAPDKSQYRKFKIKTVDGQSDVDCLQEVLMRRFKHDEWPLPDVLLIDGGKPQVHAAKKVLAVCGVGIPIVGIAKGPKRKNNEIIFGTKSRTFIKWVYQNTKTLIQVRDEAHRFAIKFQRQQRKIT